MTTRRFDIITKSASWPSLAEIGRISPDRFKFHAILSRTTLLSFHLCIQFYFHRFFLSVEIEECFGGFITTHTPVSTKWVRPLAFLFPSLISCFIYSVSILFFFSKEHLSGSSHLILISSSFLFHLKIKKYQYLILITH